MSQLPVEMPTLMDVDVSVPVTKKKRKKRPKKSKSLLLPMQKQHGTISKAVIVMKLMPKSPGATSQMDRLT